MSQTLRDKARAEGAKLRPPGRSEPLREGNKTSSSSNNFEAYYDSGKKSYWTTNSRGEWMDVTETSLKRNLRANGFSKDSIAANSLKEDEAMILRIQIHHDVQYAGPLAGYPVGLHQVCDNRILVTRGARHITPAAGQWPLLREFTRQLLGDQWQYLFGWLKSALKSLRAGPSFRPGQMLAIAGPAGCGKSLMQGLITEIFGGRAAKPYRYLTGGTDFNSELFGAEHLAIEDEAASTDLRTRRHFGAMLKNLVVNEVQSFHAKGRSALAMHPFWRLSITLNDEPENLMVLPPIDESLKDKITLLRASPTVMPFSADNLAERKKFRQDLSNELPAFIKALQDWKIPERMKDQRYGVKAHQNPDLIQEVDNLAPEFRLLTLIETLGIVDDFNVEWTGTAAELDHQLRVKDKTGEVDRMVKFNTAVGVWLARLAVRFPERFSVISHKQGQKVWQVKNG